MSMAVGEYVSVSSQRDAELADIAREKEEIATQPRAELAELTNIYMKRGLDGCSPGRSPSSSPRRTGLGRICAMSSGWIG